MLVCIANQGCKLRGAEITYGKEVARSERGGHGRGGRGIASSGEPVDKL